MKTHKWHSIAPEYSVDNEDPAIWHWCVDCGCMRLGCDVYYVGRTKMRAELDKGCPDIYFALQD